MIPLELYWPPELLAQVLPDQYGHLIAPVAQAKRKPPRFTVERRDGCTVLWLSERVLARKRSRRRR